MGDRGRIRPCCSCRIRCSARSQARCLTGGTGGWCSSRPTSAGCCWYSVSQPCSPRVPAIGRSCSARWSSTASPDSSPQGLSAALPDVVPREQVVTMNAVATATGAAAAFLGANFMLSAALGVRRQRHRSCRHHFHRDPSRRGRAGVVGALPPRRARPPTRASEPFTVRSSMRWATGWLHGARTVFSVPSVAATLSGMAAHRMVFGINTLLVLVMVRHTDTSTSRDWAPRCCLSPPPVSDRSSPPR